MSEIRIWRCKWCINRIGRSTWFNERGETVIPPKCFIPIEENVSDGICPLCLTEQLPIAETTNQRAQQET